jgi:hypothetical protein
MMKITSPDISHSITACQIIERHHTK